MAAYATDYAEKTWVANYGTGASRTGTKGETRSPRRARATCGTPRPGGLSIRNYGEFVGLSPGESRPRSSTAGSKEWATNLRGNTCPFFPGFDGDILDNARVDLWLKEFRAFEKGSCPG